MTDARVAQLESIISNAPLRTRRLAEGIVRCERTIEGDQPFAVLLFDLRGQLPDGPNELLGFEEKYLGKEFFQGPKHLKWNHYLFFVVPDTAWGQIAHSDQRRWIEQDTTYAKKVVLPDQEVKPLLLDRKWGAEVDARLVSPRDSWLSDLKPAGLDSILFAKQRSTAVRQWIEGTYTPPEQRGTEAVPQTQETSARTLAEIKWTKFRAWPKEKHFSFASVNLIDGINGVGKTSLLEAIEIFFCGETLRQRGADEENDVVAKFTDSAKFQKLPLGPAAQRRRDLQWFGSYWRQKQELAKSFNRYIFFNSDAAFQLQESSDNRQVVNALMNVALGEDATALWGQIKEFREEFEQQGAQLTRQVREVQGQLDAASGEVTRLNAIPLVAERSLHVLQGQLRAVAWRAIPNSLVEFENSYWPSIIEVGTRAESLRGLDETASTPSRIDQRISLLTTREARARRQVSDWKKQQEKLGQLTGSRASLQKVSPARRRLGQYAASGWLHTWCQYKRTSIVAETSARVMSLGRELDREILSSLDQDATIATLRRKNAEAVRAAERDLTAVRKRSDQLRSRLSALEGLASDARELGQRLLRLSPDASACPLCGQVHGEGALARRLQRRVTAVSGDLRELSGATEQAKAIEARVRRLRAVETALKLAADIAIAIEGEEQPSPTSLRRLLVSVQQIESDSRRNADSIQQLEQSLQRLRRRGFEEDDFRESYVAVFGRDLRSASPSAEVIARRIRDDAAEATKVGSDLDKEISENEEKARSSSEALTDLLAGYGRGANFETRLAQLRNALRSLQNTQHAISFLSSLCEIGTDFPLIDLPDRLSSVYLLSKEIVEASADEKLRREAIASATSRTSQYEAELNRIRPMLARAEDARARLAGVMSTHSIERVFADFLDENHTRISSILADIHAPREFVGIESWEGGGGIRLVRDDAHKTRAELTQVSTGQRSAIALSIFLTLNEKLRTSPPLILLDDPVAHVDDLNMLAFIDYLREIALSGNRQIFFASANQKVAAIFHQKFAALGEGFRAIQLTR